MSQTNDATATTTTSSTAPPSAASISQQQILSIYKRMLVSIFFAALTIIFTLLVVLMIYFIAYQHGAEHALESVPLLPVVALAGSLGAFFSSLIRLYNFEELPKALVSSGLDGLPTPYLTIYSLMPAVVGAIAAAVLYLLFASNLVQSPLFPAFACKKDLCNSFAMLIGEWSPKEATDYAKSIVWGFIGGFAERLVPDMLGSLSQSATKDEAKSQ